MFQMQCVFQDCRTNHEYASLKDIAVTFPFPDDKKRMNIWCQCLGLETSVVISLKHARLCALHFQEHDIIKQNTVLNGITKLDINLQPDAIPMPVEFLAEEDQHISSRSWPDLTTIFDVDDSSLKDNMFLSAETSTPIKVANDSGNRSKLKMVKYNYYVQKQSCTEALQGLLKLLAKCDYKVGGEKLAAGKLTSAFKCWRSAARFRHPGACFNLGLCYEKGLGVQKNEYMARCCYEKATRMGHRKAKHNLAVFYANGLGGLPKNLSQALKLLNKNI